MTNEYYGVASTPTEDFLAHYGVRGMKWGVRKAIARGSDRALRRQRVKAEKKLKKLEKLGSNGKKYAKKAIAYGAAAAGTGAVAATGTRGIWNAMGATGKAFRGVGRALNSDAVQNLGRGYHGVGSSTVRKAGNLIGKTARVVGKASTTAGKALGTAGFEVGKWGAKNTLGEKAGSALHDAVKNSSNYKNIERGLVKATGKNSYGMKKILGNTSNNQLVKLGAGAVTVGLGAAAAKNAYRAAAAKKHAAQAKQFREEMNKAFAGTKYANGVPSKKKKRRSNNA